jgi:hypothetical protein
MATTGILDNFLIFLIIPTSALNLTFLVFDILNAPKVT